MISDKIRTLVVEDELMLREELASALIESGEFEIVGQADSVQSAYDAIKKLQVDLIFLDIKIVGGLSFQVISRLIKENFPIPPIVINTGFREYEYAKKIHNEYGDHVIYILNKPFWENWLEHQERILDGYIIRKQKEISPNVLTINHSSKFITVQANRKSFVLNPPDIVIVKTGEKTKGTTEVILQNSSFNSNLSLTQLLQKLPQNFRQINRFEAINTDWVSFIDHSEREVALRNGATLSIGDSYYGGLCQLFE
jgi:DNA-binding LytR/AlgR family response regulator